MTGQQAIKELEDFITACNDSRTLTLAGITRLRFVCEALKRDLDLLEVLNQYFDIGLYYDYLFGQHLISFSNKKDISRDFDTHISNEDAEKIKPYFKNRWDLTQQEQNSADADPDNKEKLNESTSSYN